MVIAFLLFAVAVIRLHPDTPAARWLHEGLVERPVAAFARMERRHWIALFLLVGMATTGVAAELAWLMAMDSAVLIDLTIAVWTFSAVKGFRTGWAIVGGRLASLVGVRRGRPRPRQPHRSASLRPPANDDGEVRHAA